MRKLLGSIRAIIRALLLGGAGALSLWSQTVAAPGSAGAPRAARELARGTVLAFADIATDAAPAATSTIVGWETRRLV